MKQITSACAIAILIGLSFTSTAVWAGQEEDKQAIQKAIVEYVTAFNARDAKALAALWSPEGVYTSRNSGEQITGREALQADFEGLFEADSTTKLEVSTDSIEFVSPNVAIERGMAVVMRGETPPVETSYSVVYVRRDGKWLIDRTTEEQDVEPLSNYEQLKELEWMVGDWVDAEGGSVIKTTCQWTRHKNFMVRTFTATVGERVDLTGMQFVGWDAANKQIRSWVFDSDGSFSQGTWERRGDRWVVNTMATLADGRRGSATTVLRPIDDDSFGWQRINRVVDGEVMPNIDEVVIVRE